MSVSTIRLLIGDRKKAATNENVGQADGTNTKFQLDMFPLASSPTAVLSIYSSGVLVTAANYTISGDVGVITFNAAATTGNTAGNQLVANYEYYTLTSGEITDLLSGLTSKPYLAAANAALAIAADNSRLFMYVMGDKTVDKRRVHSNLIELSKELENRHYNLKETESYTATIVTMKDNSATPYDGFDTAVAVFYSTSTS